MSATDDSRNLMPPPNGSILRFGVFELDRRAGELRRSGVKVRLQEKPLRILEILIAHAGEAVSRDELRTELWPGDVFVDFDHSLNSAVSKLRDALRDTAASPRFIETLPRGYRFIADVARPVESASGTTPGVPAAPSERDRRAAPAPVVLASGPRSAQAAPTSRPRRLSRWIWAAAVLVLAAATWFAVWKLKPTPLPSPEIIALAVLPFQNLSADPGQEFFSDGITDEMIAQLGRLDPDRLRVIARTSAMHYKHTDKRIDQIGSELGVNYVLEGSVRRAGSRVRITAQLIRVRDQVRLWSRSYERELTDILVLQTEVTQSIADTIAVTFERGSGATMPSKPRVSPAVYEAYLKGRYFLDKSPAAEALSKSVASFEEALRLDPGNAGAQAGLADAYGMLGWGISAGLAPRDAYPKALAAAERALALDPQLAAANVALARIRWKYEYNGPAAEGLFKRAISLDPSAAAAHESYFDYLSAMGRNDEAFVELQRAVALDPVSFTVNYDLGLHYARTGDYDRAVRQLRATIDLDPTSGFAHHLLSQLYADRQQYPEAIAELEKALQLSPESPHFVAALAHLRALTGDRAAALRAREALHARARTTYVSPYALALLDCGLGDRAGALDLLETAYRDRDPWLTMLRVQPRLQILRGEPRFVALQQKVGLRLK